MLFNEPAGIGLILSIAGGDRVPPFSLDAMEKSHPCAISAGEHGEVYGRTTGVGANKDVELDEASSSNQDLRLFGSHATAYGPYLDPRTVRAAMAVRLHQLLQGGSGIDPSAAEALARALDSGDAPRIHRDGSMGIGDLSPAGRAGSVADRWADRRRAGALAPDRGRCAALHLEQCLHGDRGCHRLRTGHGPVETPSAHHRLLGGGLPGELAALLRTGLPGEPASLPCPDLRIPQRPAHRLLGASTRLQDTFGFRCAAQVTAPVLDQIWQLREAAEVEIDSAPETRTRHDATWGHRLRPCVAGTASATLRERAPTRSSGPARWRNTPRAVATRRGSRPAPRRSR